jgi:hypothetical protein
MEKLTREQKNRRFSINRYIRNGLTREQAEAKYDRPRGICAHCGRAAHSERARTCIKCQKRIEYERVTKWAKENPEKKRRKLPDIGRQASSVKPRKVVPGRKTLEGPIAKPRNTEPPPMRIIVPDGMQVTKIPSMMPDGVRGRGPEPWDEDPKKAAFVDRVLARMGAR